MKANNIKSIRVKDAIDFFVSWFQGMNQPKIREGINSIITLAEQDAEERAIEILKKVFKEKPITKEDFIDRFKELLGGQSNE